MWIKNICHQFVDLNWSKLTVLTINEAVNSLFFINFFKFGNDNSEHPWSFDFLFIILWWGCRSEGHWFPMIHNSLFPCRVILNRELLYWHLPIMTTPVSVVILYIFFYRNLHAKLVWFEIECYFMHLLDWHRSVWQWIRLMNDKFRNVKLSSVLS